MQHGYVNLLIPYSLRLGSDSGTKFCPFVQRTWIALEEKGIPYQYKEVNPYKRESHFLGW